MMDTRSLAFYRILMGATLIGDLIDRSRDLIAHYTDDGVNPRGLAWDHLDEDAFSIYFSTGTAEGESFLTFIDNSFSLCKNIWGGGRRADQI